MKKKHLVIDFVHEAKEKSNSHNYTIIDCKKQNLEV